MNAVTQPQIILYIACSIDGYIAMPGDDLSFLSLVESEGEDYGYQKFIDQVDTIILGRKTYDWVLKAIGRFPHEDKEVFVLSESNKGREKHVQFYSGELPTLVERLKNRPGQRNIFVDGGAATVQAFLREKLLDQMILSIVPITLGDGIRLFKSGIGQQTWKLVDTQSFPTGLVQLHYKKAH